MQQSDSSLSFDFNTAAQGLLAEFPAAAKDTVLLGIDKKGTTGYGADFSIESWDWFTKQISKCQTKKASFFDYHNGIKFCFIYTGEDRPAILYRPENLHLSLLHEFGHALDTALTNESYKICPGYHETLADCFAVLEYLRHHPQDQKEIDSYIHQRDLSHAPYDTSDELRIAKTHHSKNAEESLQLARKIAAPKFKQRIN